MIHKNRVYMSYETSILSRPKVTDSKLSLAIGPKYGIPCLFHWNLFMNSNKWQNHGKVSVLAVPFLSYTYEFKSNIWSNNAFTWLSDVLCLLIDERYACIFFLENASLLCIYVYYFSLLVSFYAYRYIFLDALPSDHEMSCMCFMYIYIYIGICNFDVICFQFFYICILFKSDNSYT